MVLGHERVDDSLLALEAPWCRRTCRGLVGGVCNHVDVELSHFPRRPLDGADRARAVQEVGQIGDVHGGRNAVSHIEEGGPRPGKTPAA